MSRIQWGLLLRSGRESVRRGRSSRSSRTTLKREMMSCDGGQIRASFALDSMKTPARCSFAFGCQAERMRGTRAAPT